MIRILHLEDDPLDAELAAREIRKGGVEAQIRHVANESEYEVALRDDRPDLILSDHGLGGFDGTSALATARRLAPEVPFIFLSGGIGEERAIDLLKHGATDYVLKDRPTRLPSVIRRALEGARLAATAREMERHLRQAQKMEAIGALAAGVAHEINNPLTYVLSNLETIREGVPVDAPVGRWAGQAIEGVLRIRSIVQDLRTFARSDETETAHLVRIETSAAQALAMAENQIRHRCRIVKDLAPAPIVLGHEGRIGQVVLNLIVNAGQALSDRRADRNEIRVRTRGEAGEAVIEVSDNGPGIPPEHRERIFDPYFTTKPADVGTGLGLSICRSIVEGYGGRIEVESEVGTGSTFRVRIPAAPPGAAARPAAAAPAAATAPERSKRRLRILVVDDELQICAAVSRILGRDHEVRTAADGAEALRILAIEAAYDLVLSDLHMPGLSGEALLAEVRRLHPGLASHVVFMTGGAVSSGPRDFLETIENLRIEKPFRSEELRRMVYEAIARV